MQAGHTAAAQRSARNEARPCTYLRRSGGSRAVRSYTPAPAAPAWDATQAQCSHHAARTNPALASVSGASRRSRAAPGRRSLIIAAIASAAMAIAVTPPLGTVLVAHAGSVRGGRARQHGRAAAIGIATAAIAVSVTSSGGDGGGGEEEEVDAASAGGGGARLPTQIILSAAPTENGNDRESDQVHMANFSGQLIQYRDPPDAHKAWRNAEQRAE